ncbi:hypothetical protein BDN70DRAFT_901944 [Pholiota conissans]|uniref:Uncharacterized protein n=1 Tax=Pholiota conissans TaxID=109636 RepID=A0A9P6CS30_9AGAR|nr:hypothetical protein BDN70DRAFT_901944 [Pholiota conissans]
MVKNDQEWVDAHPSIWVMLNNITPSGRNYCFGFAAFVEKCSYYRKLQPWSYIHTEILPKGSPEAFVSQCRGGGGGFFDGWVSGMMLYPAGGAGSGGGVVPACAVNFMYQPMLVNIVNIGISEGGGIQTQLASAISKRICSLPITAIKVAITGIIDATLPQTLPHMTQQPFWEVPTPKIENFQY